MKGVCQMYASLKAVYYYALDDYCLEMNGLTVSIFD